MIRLNHSVLEFSDRDIVSYYRSLNDISGSLISPPAPPSGEGLFLSFPHMGFYSGSEFQAFISASGGFLFKADDNNLISFGQSTAGGDGSTTKSFVRTPLGCRAAPK